MLIAVFEELALAVKELNRDFTANGMPEIPHFDIKVLGQTALIEARVDLTLALTNDVDAYLRTSQIVIKKFDEILGKYGKFYDPQSAEIWMPNETTYTKIFESQPFNGLLADPIYVLLSKAKMAPRKNRNQIIEYLAKSPPKSFFDLVAKYQVDLTEFVP